MTHIVLFGATGRLGTALRKRRPEGLPMENRSLRGTEDVPGVDVTRWEPSAVLPSNTHTVINCAALSSVVECAARPEAAFRLNSLWPAGLARHCRERGIRLVHISTDLVWSGGIPPYRSTTPGVPMSFYGWTKLLGDRAVLANHPEALVVRTSVLVGSIGASRPTFTEDILARRVTRFYADSIRHHTCAFALADRILELARSGASGLRVAASALAQCRLAYAASLIPNPEVCLAPRGVPRNLTLLPDVPVEP